MVLPFVVGPPTASSLVSRNTFEGKTQPFRPLGSNLARSNRTLQESKDRLKGENPRAGLSTPGAIRTRDLCPRRALPYADLHRKPRINAGRSRLLRCAPLVSVRGFWLQA